MKDNNKVPKIGGVSSTINKINQEFEAGNVTAIVGAIIDQHGNFMTFAEGGSLLELVGGLELCKTHIILDSEDQDDKR